MSVKSSKLVVVIAVGALALAAIGCRSSGPGTAGDQLAMLRQEIREVVPDADREQTMLASVGSMEAAMLELVTVVTRHRAELRTLVRDYGTTRLQLETALARFLEERREIAGELADAHFELKSTASADEWKQLVDAEKKALAWAAQRNLGEVPLLDGGA